MSVIDEILKMQDKSYAAFCSKLIPNVNNNLIIGVKAPKLKRLAKTVNERDINVFISSLPHKYLEENNFHAYYISSIDDYDNAIFELKKFLPFVDNWATCDALRPKVVKQNKDKFLSEIKQWLKSFHVYTVRFAIEMLMTHYLDDDFKIEYAELVSNIRSDEYYLNMMIAWYFATALAKQYNDIIVFLQENRLSKWVHNKTIQKAIESYRISDDKKVCLRRLKKL